MLRAYCITRAMQAGQDAGSLLRCSSLCNKGELAICIAGCLKTSQPPCSGVCQRPDPEHHREAVQSHSEASATSQQTSHPHQGLISQKGARPHTCCKADDALMALLVCDGLPPVAAGLAEAKYGALCVDLAQALKDLHTCGAVLHQPVHLLLLICIGLHSTSRVHSTCQLSGCCIAEDTAHQVYSRTIHTGASPMMCTPYLG